jgi:hypothetical protein
LSELGTKSPANLAARHWVERTKLNLLGLVHFKNHRFPGFNFDKILRREPYQRRAKYWPGTIHASVGSNFDSRNFASTKRHLQRDRLFHDKQNDVT